jgi:hypothetical protein
LWWKLLVFGNWELGIGNWKSLPDKNFGKIISFTYHRKYGKSANFGVNFLKENLRTSKLAIRALQHGDPDIREVSEDFQNYLKNGHRTLSAI